LLLLLLPGEQTVSNWATTDLNMQKTCTHYECELAVAVKKFMYKFTWRTRTSNICAGCFLQVAFTQQSCNSCSIFCVQESADMFTKTTIPKDPCWIRFASLTSTTPDVQETSCVNCMAFNCLGNCSSSAQGGHLDRCICSAKDSAEPSVTQ